MSPLSEPSREPYDIGDPPSRTFPPFASRISTPQERHQVLDAIFARPEVRHSLQGIGADFLLQDGSETFTATRWFDGRYCLIYTKRLPRSSLPTDPVIAHSKSPLPYLSTSTRFILSKDGDEESVDEYKTELNYSLTERKRNDKTMVLDITLDEFLARIAP